MTNQNEPYRLIEKPTTVAFSHPDKNPATIIENPKTLNQAMNLDNPFATQAATSETH